MSVIEIPFAKLHGDENDFLITWSDKVPPLDLPLIARRICARTTGIGADGWMLATRSGDDLITRLFNADGSEPEISGNGTRCAAAFAYRNGFASKSNITIVTQAGRKRLVMIEQCGLHFQFEMDMGMPKLEELDTILTLNGRQWNATLLNVGNPQCAIFVDEFPSDWRIIAAEAEGLSRFPNRSNISIVKSISRHVIEAVFYERGAGETRSSGTGSTGAAIAAILRGVAESPVEVRTPAGSLKLHFNESYFLTGPAVFIGEGVFSFEN